MSGTKKYEKKFTSEHARKAKKRRIFEENGPHDAAAHPDLPSGAHRGTPEEELLPDIASFFGVKIRDLMSDVSVA